jgi:dTDP-4-dehydrorhamnose reductase
MNTIFLTGSSGFFGTNIQQALHGRYHIIPSHSNTLDITDADAVSKAIREANPTYVIHASAIASSQYCNDHPDECHRINVVGTEHVARACGETGCKLIFLSTEQVFNGNTSNGPYDEEQTPEPAGEYGKSKLLAEQVVAGLCRDHVILRLTWLFDYPKPHYSKGLNNILINTIESMKREKPFRVPANEFRGMTWIKDLVGLFPKLLQLEPGVYHTGSENPLDRHDTVRFIMEELGANDTALQLLVKDTTTYGSRARDIRLDTNKLRQFGIVFPSTEEALHTAIKEWRTTR